MESFQRGPFFFSFFLFPGQMPCHSSPPTPESITRSRLLGPRQEPNWGNWMQPRPERGAAFGCVPNVGGATRRGCRSHLRPSGERLSVPWCSAMAIWGWAGGRGHSAYLKSQLRLRNPRGGGRPESKLWGFLMPHSKN